MAWSRRAALVAGAGAVAAGAAASLSSSQPSSSQPSASSTQAPPSSQRKEQPMNPSTSPRMPVVYVPHGGGPWPFVDLAFGTPAEYDDLKGYLRALPAVAPTAKALLVISAHWEEPTPTVTTSSAPPLLFDYYGFPPESYTLTWPAPGDPALAARTRALLDAAGFRTASDAKRGYDHGTFVPLKVSYPEAQVPVVQLSLQQGLDPATHLAMGRALLPLRDEGVLIVGSGMTYHNLRAFGSRSAPVAEAFDAWLRETTTLTDTAERDRRLTSWERAPAARLAHPREEHLLPLMVIAGAAGADVGRVAWNGTFAGLRLSAHHFG